MFVLSDGLDLNGGFARATKPVKAGKNVTW